MRSCGMGVGPSLHCFWSEVGQSGAGEAAGNSAYWLQVIMYCVTWEVTIVIASRLLYSA